MPLLYQKQDHIGILTLSRPDARNAWCNEFTEGLQERLPELEDDRDIRCVILPATRTAAPSVPGPT
jgi:enoyl-CoA hydratase/carnithine racemase